jgi:hypothetical protein
MNNQSNTEPAINLQQLRDLRECLQHNKEAQLELALNYAAGNIGNLDQETSASYIRQVSNSYENPPENLVCLFKF